MKGSKDKGLPPTDQSVTQTPGALAREGLQAELEYRPRFRQEDIEDILQLGRTSYGLQRELEPETFAARDAALKDIIARIGQPLTPQMESGFRERFRSEEALGGRLGSPVGSSSIARELADIEEQARATAVSAALGYSNRIEMPGSQRTQSYGSLVSPVVGAGSDIYGTQLNYLGNQAQRRSQERQAAIQAIGKLGGQAMSLAVPHIGGGGLI